MGAKLLPEIFIIADFLELNEYYSDQDEKNFRDKMNSVIEELNNNLKLVYRQALDADIQLDQLQKQGHGKFSALFTKESAFNFEAKRFKPYVLDVAADVEALSKNELLDETQLKNVVLKLQQIHQLLATFKNK